MKAIQPSGPTTERVVPSHLAMWELCLRMPIALPREALADSPTRVVCKRNRPAEIMLLR